MTIKETLFDAILSEIKKDRALINCLKNTYWNFDIEVISALKRAAKKVINQSCEIFEKIEDRDKTTVNYFLEKIMPIASGKKSHRSAYVGNAPASSGGLASPLVSVVTKDAELF